MDTNTKEKKEGKVQEKKEIILQDSLNDKQYQDDGFQNKEQPLIDTVIRMYHLYVSIDTISDFTSLSEEDIQKIIDNNQELLKKMDEDRRRKEQQEDRKIYCEGYIKGRESGLDCGVKSAIETFNKKDIIDKMYNAKLSVEEISAITNLSTDEIQEIIKKYEEV